MLRRIYVLVFLVLFVAACGDENQEKSSTSLGVPVTLGGRYDPVSPSRSPALAAGLTVSGASASLTWSTGPTWSLSKTGALTGSVVTWTIVATEGPVAPGALVVYGTLPLSNEGEAPAPIGNLVVNLQRRAGNAWVTVASDIADATAGDAATSALIHAPASSERKGTFTETAASGPLKLTDPATGADVSLTAPIVLGPGVVQTLAFQAAFDAVALGLAPGMPLRVEVLVTYGNAPIANSTPDLDINGNGTIDTDEGRVSSAVTRIGLKMPSAAPGTGAVTLVDGLEDITTTGTVTFSEAEFTLGPTGGTVTVTVDGGSDGGTITNCARLNGAAPNGGDLTACSPVDVAATPACTPGTPGCGWSPGDLITFSQAAWLDPSGVSPVAFGDIQICGASPLANMSVREFLAVANTALGGGSTGYAYADLDAIALQLNGSFRDGPSAFAQAHLVNGPCSTGEAASYLLTFGQGDWGDTSGIAAKLLSDSFGSVYFAAGGVLEVGIPGSTGFSIRVDAPGITAYLPATGAPGALTSDHIDSSTTSSGSFGGNIVALKLNVDYSDAGLTGGAGPRLLLANYASVYFSAGGVLEVGIPGIAGFSMRFQNVQSVVSYLPATGAPAALTSDLIDPTTSSSGSFGGEVVALKLNVDFDDADLLSGSPAVVFGDLRVCGIAAEGLNDRTVREILAMANTALGGGAAGVTIAELNSLLVELNAAFLGGSVSTFAQNHLVNGPCNDPPPSCTPGAPGCGWETGDLVTHGQGDWGSTSGTAQTLLSGHFNSVYSSTAGLRVGILGTSGFSMAFLDASNVTAYLPASGAPGPLTSDLLNPTTSASGSFGGNTVALKLNIDFSDADLTGGTAAVAFGDLLICGAAPLANMSVRDFLTVANTALGGGSTGYAFADLDAIATQLNGSFRDGPSEFAQQHLFMGSCP